MALAAVLTAWPAHAEPVGWQASGDLRTGYAASRREARDGTETDDDSFRARIRFRLSRNLGGGWLFSGRLAGTYASDQDRFSAYVRRHRPSRTGLEAGDTTLDELYLGWLDAEGLWNVRAGRFQTSFNLPVVPAKSLDRNDSSGFGIGWTDGVHVQRLITPAWRGHLIAQVHSRGANGTGNTLRTPLDFTDSSARAGLFAGLQAEQNPGPLILRMIGLTWLPDSLASEGQTSEHREDFLALTTKLAASWSVGPAKTRLVAAGEFGHALNRPRREVVGLSGDRQVSGNAWQLAASAYDIRPGHHLGVVYGRAQAGWLISTDFRNNDELAEIRYQRLIRPGLTVETRFRWRRELELPEFEQRQRIDRDIYIRLNARFP
ncbi:MAG: porin [Wenzhouxiangella sp.]